MYTFKVGDKFYHIKSDKEFIITEIIEENNSKWFYIEAKNVIFKGVLHKIWKNSITEVSLINGIKNNNINIL